MSTPPFQRVVFDLNSFCLQKFVMLFVALPLWFDKILVMSVLSAISVGDCSKSSDLIGITF